ncbi:MAG: hypothetical protein JW902_15255 [Syntrophaceae bacterium]|nr:hypothetical protein [Syntrophaceae bacterium]
MKTREWGKWVICVLGILVFIGCNSKPTAPPDNFTAKMVTLGIETPMAKMGPKSRVENPMMNGVVTISEAGSAKVIMMSSANKTYFEQTVQNQPPAVDEPGVAVDKKKIGSETLDGHPCDKYDVVMYRKDKPEDKYRGRIWEATDLGGLAIRTEMDVPAGGQAGGKMIMELKDVKLGTANASMFEVPADYKKVGSTMELLAGAGSYPGPADIEKMKELMQKMRKH